MSKDGIDVYAFHSGLDYKGTSLGSNSFLTLKKPEIAMLVGDGFSATDAGEVWHLFDTRFNIPLTLIPVDVFNRSSITRYNTIIIPPTVGSIQISESGKEKLKQWVQNGGVVIGLENALNWLNTVGLGKFDMKKEEEKKDPAPRKAVWFDRSVYRRPGNQRCYFQRIGGSDPPTSLWLLQYNYARLQIQ